MCLIAYVPAGLAVPREYFDYSAEQNPHGFGVMSVADGVRHFFGKKSRKRARNYCAELSARGVPYGVHWRWATHGTVSAANVHPFTTPNGHAHVMHNGVIHSTAKYATAEKSDTVLFVELLTDAPAGVAPGQASPYWGGVENAIGSNSRMLVLNGDNFYILNESAGVWIDGVWYSNTYSLPLGAGDDDDTPYATTADDWNVAQDRSYWDSLLADDKPTWQPELRYDPNLGKWRRPEDKKSSDFRAWLNELQPYELPLGDGTAHTEE